MEPTKPNVEIFEKQARPQDCIMTILRTFERTVSKRKGIQHIMVENTKEQNIDLWVAYWWLQKNREAMIDIPIDMPREERTEMCDMSIRAFKDAENKIRTIEKVVSISSIIMDRDEIEKTLQDNIDERLTLDKLNEIMSIINMSIEDTKNRSN